MDKEECLVLRSNTSVTRTLMSDYAVVRYTVTG